jgi:hypothetical protein
VINKKANGLWRDEALLIICLQGKLNLKVNGEAVTTEFAVADAVQFASYSHTALNCRHCVERCNRVYVNYL